MNTQALKARTAKDSVTSSSKLTKTDFIQLVTVLLEDVLQTYESAIQSMKQELALIENARLYINKKAGRYYFRCRPKDLNKEISISNDETRIYKLARRAYLEERLSALDIEIKKIRRRLNDAAAMQHELKRERLLNRFDYAGLDLCQILFTKEQNEWINEVFSPNPYKPEGYRYQTDGGVWVRSKSEAKIGSALEAIGWPYRNDDFVRIITDGPADIPFRDSYYADFKVPNLLGGITIHEHLGAFQMDTYADNGLRRLNDYHNFTVVEIPERPVTSSEFTWSFESDVVGKGSLNSLIRKMLLPIF